MCSQCTRGGKTCKYSDQAKPSFEFVNRHRVLVTGSDETSTCPSETWSSVLDNQENFIRKAEEGNDGVPVWAVAEAQEACVHYSRDDSLTVGRLQDQHHKSWR